MMDKALQRVLDEHALQQLAYRYAEAIDRRNLDAALVIFTEDGVIEGPGFLSTGAEGMRMIMEQLGNFQATQHFVHNSLFDIDGDNAKGETYCVASHLMNQSGTQVKLDWGIRYQDTCVRVNEEWRFKKRALIVEWTETSEVNPVEIA